MSNQESLLKKAFNLVDEAAADDNGCIVLLGIEINQEGVPVSKGIKVRGNPAATLASMTLLELLVQETKADVLSRISSTSDSDEVSKESVDLDKNSLLVKQLAKLESLGLLTAFLDDVENNEKDERLRNMIKEFRKRFGK
jgi:hypothetical protein